MLWLYLVCNTTTTTSSLFFPLRCPDRIASVFLAVIDHNVAQILNLDLLIMNQYRKEIVVR